jgi:hypothetical protein
MQNRREVPRFLFEVIAKLSDRNSTNESIVSLTNIGLNGCHVDGCTGLKADETHTLTIGWRGSQIELEAVVVWAKRDGHAGLRFQKVSRQNWAVLQELTSTLLTQPVAWPPRRDQSPPTE